MKVRVTYGLDKLLEGAIYHEAHILADLRALARPATAEPAVSYTYLSSKIVGVDTEYSKDNELLTVGLADSSNRHAMDSILKPEHLSHMRGELHKKEWVVGHNIPGDIDQLLRNGLPVK